MPYSLVLHCLSKGDALTPEDLQGQKSLALFLQELIQKQDAVLAASLHAPKHSKPFTTAILAPPGSGGLWPSRGPNAREVRNRWSVSSGEVKIRFTLLDDALYPLMSQFFLQHLDGLPILRLGRAPLVISKVTATSESGEAWAGCARFEDLLAQASEDGTAWNIRFVTPTAFRSGAADISLPRLCF